MDLWHETATNMWGTYTTFLDHRKQCDNLMEFSKHIQQITTTMRVDRKHESQQAHAKVS